MSTIKPIYRLELRAPRTETVFTGVSNSAETAILQPAAGAAHRDWFRVASEAVSFSAKLAGTTASWVRATGIGTWPTTAISVEVWFRSNDPERSFGLFSYAVSGQDNEVLLFVDQASNTDGTSRLQWWIKGASNTLLSGIGNLADGKWHRVVATWRDDTDATTITVDDVLASSGSITASAITSGGTMYIGQEQANVDVLDTYRSLDGNFASVRVYNRVLTAQEIAEHYRGVFTSETGLLLNWDFEGMGRGTKVESVTDKSGSFNTGHAQGVEWVDDTPVGWKPYLKPLLRGRAGRIDMKGRRLDIGSRQLTILDRRTAEGGSNLNRWWSAFFGDARGRPRGQLKAVVQESLDDGATFADLAVGRASATGLDRRVQATLTVRDETEMLKRKVFTGQPHSSITYTATLTTLPLGTLGSDYGTGSAALKASLPLTGAAKDMTISGGSFQTTVKLIELDAASVGRLDNVVTQELLEAVSPNSYPQAGALIGQMVSLPNFSGPARARIKHTSGALNGQTGDYRVGMLNLTSGIPNKVQKFAIEALPTGDKNALALPAAGVTVELHIYIDALATQRRPLYVNDVDPATLLIDLAAGKFGWLWRAPATLPADKAYGDVTWSVPVKASGPTAPSTHVGTRPPFRGIITKSDEFVTWVEKNLLKQYHWAIFLDRSGQLNLVDLRLPSSLAGIATIADVDLVDDQDLGWDHDPTAAISRVDFKRYLDVPLTTEIVTQTGGPKITSLRTRSDIIQNGVIDSIAQQLIILDVGSFDHGDETYEIDATGYRTIDGEALQNQDRGIYLEKQLVELANHLRWPFAWGLTTIDVACRRTATVNALSQGALVLLAASDVPDPTTHARGGTRLCRVLEMTEEGLIAKLRLVDLAVNAVAAQPSLAQPAQEAGNTFTGVTSVLTLNESGQPAEVRYAVTDTAVGTAPVDASALWSVLGVFKAAGTVTIRNVPPNMRVWVQGRSIPSTDFEPQLPSLWKLADGTGRVDTAALPAPSAPTTAAITGQSSAKTRRVSWTNGATDLMTEVLLATPVTDPRARVATVLPGSTSYDLYDLIPSTAYRVGVRHSLGGRFYSAEVTADFTTDSTGTVAPNMGGIAILR